MKSAARRVQGRVLWDDNNAPVQGAVVTLGSVTSSKRLATAKVDKKGEYELGLPHDDCEQLLYVTVSDRAGRRLATSYEMAVRSNLPFHQLDITAPASARHERKRPSILAGDIALDAAEFSRAKEDIVLDLARAMVEPEYERKVRHRLEAISPELVPSEYLRRTLCGTGLLEAMNAIIRLKRWPREVALQVDDILRLRHLPKAAFATQVHLCPNFRITYQDSGAAAVDPDTSAQAVVDPGSNPSVVLTTLPAGGVPTYIKRVCFWLERALATYVNPPFSMRNPAAGGRIEVEVNSAAFGSASASIFYINNALPPDVLCAVTVHELFHMVQYQYSGGGFWRSAMLEGGATWAEDCSADFLNRYLDEAGTNFNGSGYMITPHTSLEAAGFRYKTSLFWRYVAEQHSPRIAAGDEPLIGVETYRTIIERCEAGSWSSNDVRDALRSLPWYQDFYDFAYLDPARLDLTSGETTLGNFALACYLKDLGTNVPDRRFDFMEDEENIFIDDVIATVIAGSPLQATLASVTLAGSGTVTNTSAVTFISSLDRFASRYYEIAIDPGVTNVELTFSVMSSLTSSIFQAVLIDTNGAVREIYRTDKASYVKRFPNLAGRVGLQKVVLVATGAASSGGFRMTAASAGAAPDVMVTRWHTPMQREYEIDSSNWAWTWVSPDIYVDNDLDGVADNVVYFNTDNKLHIRLHNKGNAAATGIDVQFWYQDASGGLSPSAWLPVVNTAGTVQALSGLSLAAGASGTFSVDWSPAPSGNSHHFCVRAVVSVPGDPNVDNKRVLSNFGNVKLNFRRFLDIKLTRRNPRPFPQKVEIAVVPRGIPGLEVAPRDLAQAATILEPGAETVDTLRLSYFPPQKAPSLPTLVGRTRSDDCPCHDPIRSLARRPAPNGDYPVDPRTLPPGVAGKPLLTLVHFANDLPLGGVTLVVDTDGTAPKMPAKKPKDRAARTRAPKRARR